MNAFEWTNPSSVAEVFELTVRGAAVKAGGVDLIDLMKEGIRKPSRVVNLRGVPGMDQISEDANGVTIGPLVTLAMLAENPIIQKNFTVLSQAAGHAATPQIRNQATLGGNLLQRPRCWYFRNELFPCRKKGGEICYAQEGENQYHAIFNHGLCAIVHPSATAIPLVAMRATVEITGPKEKRTVPLEEFFTPPMVDLHRENSLKDDELLSAVRIPALPGGAKSAYIKQGEKESFDWPIADAAVVLEMNGTTCRNASVVLGAASPVPHRAKQAEDLLKGQSLTPDIAAKAGEAAMKTASPMSQNAYKIPLFRAIIARTILAAAGGAA